MQAMFGRLELCAGRFIRLGKSLMEVGGSDIHMSLLMHQNSCRNEPGTGYSGHIPRISAVATCRVPERHVGSKPLILTKKEFERLSLQLQNDAPDVE